MYIGQGQDFKLTMELSEKVQYSRKQLKYIIESTFKFALNFNLISSDSTQSLFS